MTTNPTAERRRRERYSTPPPPRNNNRRRRRRTGSSSSDQDCGWGGVEAIMVTLLGGLVLLVVLLIGVGAIQAGHAGSGNYLYAVDDFDNGPVQELLNGTNPDFLFSVQKNDSFVPRLVEFYAPWCGHCRHYRSKYVQLARQVQNLTLTDVSVHAVSCTVHRSVCKEFGIRSYPTVKYFAPGSVNATDISPWAHPFQILQQVGLLHNDTNTMMSDGGVFLPQKSSSFAWQSQGGWSSLFQYNAKTPTTHVKNKLHVYQDAWLSLDFGLRQGIYFANGPLHAETAKELEEWIGLLHYALPQAWKIHELLNDLRNNMDNITKSETILLDIVNRHPPPTKEWSDDCKTQGDTGAFTCGLWELFHIVTVGVVEWNVHSADVSDNFLTLETADTIRGYVANFFACEECRVNFLAAYDNCDYDRCNRLVSNDNSKFKDWIELPLWLWELHNGVNVRLMKERASAKSVVVSETHEQEARWPLAQDCPACWKNDGTWVEDAVYKYLRIQYWPTDDTTARNRQEVLPAKTSVSQPPTWVVFVSTIGLPIIFFQRWYTKRLQRIRSGRHKKELAAC